MSHCSNRSCCSHTTNSLDKPINVLVDGTNIPLFLGQQLRLTPTNDITISASESVYGTHLVIGRDTSEVLPPGTEVFEIATENEGARTIVPSAVILSDSTLTFRGEGRTQVSIDQATPNDNTLVINTPLPEPITLGVANSPLGPDIVSSPLLGGGNLRIVQGDNIVLTHTTLPDGGAITIDATSNTTSLTLASADNVDGPDTSLQAIADGDTMRFVGGNNTTVTGVPATDGARTIVIDTENTLDLTLTDGTNTEPITQGDTIQFQGSGAIQTSVGAGPIVTISAPNVLENLDITDGTNTDSILSGDTLSILGGTNVTTNLVAGVSGPELTIDAASTSTTLTLASADNVDGPNTSSQTVTDGDTMRIVGGTNTTVTGSTATDGARSILIDTQNPLDLTLADGINIESINQGDTIQFQGSGAIQTSVGAGPIVSISAPNVLENLDISDGTNTDSILSGDTLSILGGTNVTTNLVDGVSGPELTIDVTGVITGLTIASSENPFGGGPITSSQPVSDGNTIVFAGRYGSIVTDTFMAPGSNDRLVLFNMDTPRLSLINFVINTLNNIAPDESRKIGFPSVQDQSKINFNQVSNMFSIPGQLQGIYRVTATCNLVNDEEITLTTDSLNPIPTVSLSLVTQDDDIVRSVNFTVTGNNTDGFILPGIQSVTLDVVIRVPNLMGGNPSMYFAITNGTSGNISPRFGYPLKEVPVAVANIIKFE